jgi:hypothetical protein
VVASFLTGRTCRISIAGLPGSPEECYEQLRPCWEAVGANFLFFRTHWLGMPLAHALASMRLMSDELLPALRQVKG